VPSRVRCFGRHISDLRAFGRHRSDLHGNLEWAENPAFVWNDCLHYRRETCHGGAVEMSWSLSVLFMNIVQTLCM